MPIFRQDARGAIHLLEAEHATNEFEHLHRLVEANLELIPGDQLRPEIKSRWLMIGSEVSVADPSSGIDTWKLDLLLSDQERFPVLVECKRFLNDEIRREVVGQVIEYAANAQHYWTAESLLRCAERTFEARGGAGGLRVELAQRLHISDEPEAYFAAVAENLRAGRFGIVFVTDAAHPRLRSVAEFLNREFESIMVSIVELRRYPLGGDCIIESRVSGFTESIRAQRHEARTAREGAPRDLVGFTDWANGVGGASMVDAVNRLVAAAPRFTLSANGSLMLLDSEGRTLFALRTDLRGALEWYLGQHPVDSDTWRALDEASTKVGRTAATKYPVSRPDQWLPSIGFIEELLQTGFGGAR